MHTGRFEVTRSGHGGRHFGRWARSALHATEWSICRECHRPYGSPALFGLPQRAFDAGGGCLGTNQGGQSRPGTACVCQNSTSTFADADRSGPTTHLGAAGLFFQAQPLQIKVPRGPVPARMLDTLAYAELIRSQRGRPQQWTYFWRSATARTPPSSLAKLPPPLVHRLSYEGQTKKSHPFGISPNPPKDECGGVLRG